MLDGRGHVKITDFGLASLDREIAGTEIRSGRNAPVAADRRAAWEGTYPGQDAVPVHIEARVMLAPLVDLADKEVVYAVLDRDRR